MNVEQRGRLTPALLHFRTDSSLVGAGRDRPLRMRPQPIPVACRSHAPSGSARARLTSGWTMLKYQHCWFLSTTPEP